MILYKTKRRSLIMAIVSAVVLVMASWTLAGAAQLTVTCQTAPCQQLQSGTYEIGSGGFTINNGDITISLDSAPYNGVIAGTVAPLPPIPDVTVYLRKAGPSTGISYQFYYPELDGTEQGKYEFLGLPDGNYVVSVDAAGYQFSTPYHKVKIVQGSITTIDDVQVGTSTDVNFAYTPLVDGVCGSSDGQTLATAPTTGLCTLGSASGVSGSGPWTWSCAGSGGGTTANCSANKQDASGAIDLGAPYPRTTPVSVAAGQASNYYFNTTQAASMISIQMTTTDWTGDLDLMASNVKQPTCDQMTLRYSSIPALVYGPVTGSSNESLGMSINAPAGTRVYVTVCNRTNKTAAAKLYWSVY